MGILRSRGRENKKDILGKGIIFAHADISACIGGLGGHCRELKREEFLNEGVLNFKAACMNTVFCFFFFSFLRVMCQSVSLVGRKLPAY